MRLGAAALTLWVAGAAFGAPDPCDGIVLADGKVTTARRLGVRAPLKKADVECATAVGKALRERGGVRSITLAVRLPDALRVGDGAQKVGAAYTQALVAGGIPEARISVVVPAASHGEQDSIEMAFTERRGKRPVARVQSAEGDVQAGRGKGKLKPIKEGEDIPPRSLVKTGANSRAWLQLADGSRIKLLPSTSIKLGRMQLNAGLKREVKIDLQAGKVETDVRSGGEGSSFEISTPTGVAGVRGTNFRLGGDDESMRLETLDGEVALTAEGQTVAVKAGFASTAKKGQPPAPPTAMLDPPKVEGPLQGVLGGQTLRWSSVSGASAYQVEFARDAEFTYEVTAVRADDPALPAEALPLGSGKWYWRASGLDSDGFGGRTSKVYAFTWDGAPKK